MPAFAFDYNTALDSLLKENGLAPEGQYKPLDVAKELGLNPPVPCIHKAGCNHEGACAFVHPGEEGTGLKYFPERTRLDSKTETMVTQKAAIRLVNNDGSSPAFYTRRRQNYSWSSWCSRHNIPYSPNRTGRPPAPAAPAPAARPGQGSWASAPTARPGQGSWASVAAAPRPAPQLPQQNMYPSWGYGYGYPMGGYGMAHHMPSIPMSPDMMASFQQFLAQQSPPRQSPPRQHEDVMADRFGNAVYQKVNALLPTLKDGIVAKGVWPKMVTNLPGKITGMFLHMDSNEIEQVLSDNDLLVERMFDACEVLVKHEK